jgi:hypothetical protein
VRTAAHSQGAPGALSQRRQRAEQLGEPAELIFHSFIVNVLLRLIGADYYNSEALEAVFDVDRGAISVEEIDVMNSKLRFSIPAFEDAYRPRRSSS